MKSYILSGVAILASAVPGCLLAYWLVSLTGLTGLWLALATVPVAMLFSVGLFAALAAIGKALGVTK
jgi:hypothetical protein